MSVSILIGDCRERMKELADASVDSVVCDPPYHLTSGNVSCDWGSFKDRPKGDTNPAGRGHKAKSGFMGQKWDGGDIAQDPAMWAEVLRVLKPGGHLVAFSGTRTQHRMVCAIEDAGFEIRDQLGYCYGSGFPKSLNVTKAAGEAICRCAPSDDQLRGVRQGKDDAVRLVSAGQEADLLEAMQRSSSRPRLGEARPQGRRCAPVDAGYADGEESSLEGRGDAQTAEGQLQGRPLCEGSRVGAADGSEGSVHHGASVGDGTDVRLPADTDGGGQPQGPQSGEQSPVELGTIPDERGPQARGSWPLCGRCDKPIIPEGLGTALKPAWEPICLARKPLESTVAANVLKHGTGALNIDGCRIESSEETPVFDRTGNPTNGVTWDMGTAKAVGTKPAARWPANLCHDGSDEVLAGFPEVHGAGAARESIREADATGMWGLPGDGHRFGDSGSAARFFYTAKASPDERGEGNSHPTVKPIALMRWLCRLVTPPGGTILDPFAGSGSTLIAADAEQFNAIGCELSPEYAAIAERRVRDAAGMFADVKVAA